MSKLFLKFSQTALLVIFASVLLLPVSAQKQPESAPKKSSGASSTCDGALDIVPTKALSFVRKRRPAKSESKQQPATANSKAQPKPSSN
ncbi:MAG: hypothetical protein JST85_27585 [Acidobacteria bacterium]|nr:hypothetical protein [Acidobacteriota bacterium]